MKADSRERSVLPVAFEYALFLWFLVAFDLFALLLPQGIEATSSAVHASLLIAGTVRVMVRMWREEFAAVLSPLWYGMLLTTAFYGFGVLFVNFGNDASREWVDRHYYVTGPELLAVNLVVSVGLATTWSAATWVLGLPRGVKPGAGRERNISPVWLARYFFVVGFGVQYLLVLPYMLGLTSRILPGFVMILVNVSFAAIFLMAVCSHQSGGRIFRLLLPIGVSAGLLAGLLVTSKTWIVLSLAFYFLGQYYARRQLRGLFVGVLVVALVYIAVTPFTHFVRNSFVGQDGRDINESAAILVDYLETEDVGDDQDIQWWFLRLSYVSAQAYAITQYESGSPGDTVLSGMRELLLPRVLFPDKPVRSLGSAFSEEYGGNPNNSKSPGVFAEAFWNGGWLALLLVSTTAGLLLGAAHRFIVTALRAENWVVLPLCVGLFLGLGQIHGFFSNVFVYQPLVLLIVQAGLYALAMLLANPGGRQTWRATARSGVPR